jgi:hypothetical protein
MGVSFSVSPLSAMVSGLNMLFLFLGFFLGVVPQIVFVQLVQGDEHFVSFALFDGAHACGRWIPAQVHGAELVQI